MRYGKVFIGLFTALLMLVAVVFARKEYAVNVSIRAEISSPAGVEEVACWNGGDGAYYLFLPSYAELSQVTLHSNTSAEVSLNGLPLEGMNCADLALDTAHAMQYPMGNVFSLTILRSGSVPALYVDTSSGTMAYIHDEKGKKEPGSLRLYTASGELDYAGDLKAVSGRGNSTWGEEKKPYNLTLQAEGDLLGMGAAKKWILLANALDETHMRNKIVYDFAQEIGLPNSPMCQWVDLYLNGEYAGLYLLCERNEIHPQRVDIAQESSFLVSKEWEWRMEAQGDPFVTTASGAALRLRDGAMEESAVLDVLQHAENAILSPEGIDPVTGKHWRELIDTESWIKKYLVEEVFGNIDGGTLSQYFYYNGSDGKLYAGPVWDYDLTMGNPWAIQPEYHNQIFASRPDVWGSPWYHALYENQDFYEEMVSVYENTFLPALEKLLSQGITQYEAVITEAAAMDQLRWDTAALPEEAASIRDYMSRRVEFLTELWVKEEPFVRLIANGYDGAKNCYYLNPGELAPELLRYDYIHSVEFLGWFYEGTEILFDPAAPITEDTEIRLRYQAIDVAPQGEEEPHTPLRYAPVVIFAGILVLAYIIDRKRNSRKKQKHPAQVSRHPQ